MRFPLSGRARDFHPLDYAHVGRTKKKCNDGNTYRCISVYYLSGLAGFEAHVEAFDGVGECSYRDVIYTTFAILAQRGKGDTTR